MQNTSHILMIRPYNFTYNAQTAVNNSFQNAPQGNVDANAAATAEFDAFSALLKANGIEVHVVQDTAEPPTPDSIFPNNWISFHQSGRVCLYPMFAENRRQERKSSVTDYVKNQFVVNEWIDFSHYEEKGRFLEGTGSMVLDRENKIAYACLSPRTDKAVLEEWALQMGYKPVSFHSVDEAGSDIYHTNVMMCVANKYVVICLDSIPTEVERNVVIKTIEATGKEIVAISCKQMNQFAGNMLQVVNKQNQPFLIMSSTAYNSLSQEQINQLSQYNTLLHSNLSTIETLGGGSARCMLAEVFLPIK